MAKSNIGKMRVGISPSVIVGALVNGKENYITLGQCSGLSMNPPMMYISINKAHYTNDGIKENGYFSVNIPSDGVVQKMDYVGLVSGRDTDKSSVFTPFYGEDEKAPMIEECPVNILCKLINTVDLPNNEVFIGEIVETYVGKEFIIDEKPDLKKINPLLLAGGQYCELGNPVAATREVGKLLK